MKESWLYCDRPCSVRPTCYHPWGRGYIHDDVIRLLRYEGSYVPTHVRIIPGITLVCSVLSCFGRFFFFSRLMSVLGGLASYVCWLFATGGSIFRFFVRLRGSSEHTGKQADRKTCRPRPSFSCWISSANFLLTTPDRRYTKYVTNPRTSCRADTL